MNLTRSQAINLLFVKEVNDACINEQAAPHLHPEVLLTCRLARDLNMALDKRTKLLEALHMLTVNGCI